MKKFIIRFIILSALLFSAKSVTPLEEINTGKNLTITHYSLADTIVFKDLPDQH